MKRLGVLIHTQGISANVVPSVRGEKSIVWTPVAFDLFYESKLAKTGELHCLLKNLGYLASYLSLTSPPSRLSNRSILVDIPSK